MSLVDKFKNLKVNSKNTLNNEDMAYCDRVTRQANEVREQLNEIYKKHIKLYEEENLGYTFYEYGAVNSPRRSDLSEFDLYKFSYSYSVRDLRKLITGLENTYQSNILSYFSGKYNLKLYSVYDRHLDTEYRKDFTEEQEFSVPFDYAKIIDYIRHRTDNEDFESVGIRNFKESFKRYFDKRNGYEVKGATMIIANFYKIYPSNWGRAYEPEASTMEELSKGFNFFETDSLGAEVDNTLNKLIGINYDFTITPFENLTKIKSIRFFKSGRADIKFRDALALQEFERFYQLEIEN